MNMRDACAEPATTVLSLTAALERLLGAMEPLQESESIPLKQAAGRVLAAPVVAPFDLPPFANSAMDGYALKGRDLDAARHHGLALIGHAFAGRPFTGEIEDGQCVRIFTGAPLPVGADTVVMQELSVTDGDRVRFAASAKSGSNVRPAGDDAPAGTPLLEQGRRLTPVDLGLLASAGIAAVPVIRKLRVAHFSTGDELIPLGQDLGYGEIYDSNRYLLHGLLEAAFIDACDLGVVRDERAALATTLRQAADQADIILSSAGVSVGEADLVTGVLAELGRIDFWKIAVKPGKPFAFGRIGGSWFCGLPGNPAAVLVAFLQLVRPALLHLAGAQAQPALRLSAVATDRLRKSPGRMEFQRGRLAGDASGRLAVAACGSQGSHRLSGASQANCLIVLPEDSAGVEPGDWVEIEPLWPVW